MILIITHSCNLDCAYCPVIKEKKSIKRKTAESAANIFFSWPNENKHIRFFGGEPFLEFGLIKDIIVFAKTKAANKGGKLTFDITTNGSLLNNAAFGFLYQHPEIELIISLDGNRSSHLLNRFSTSRRLDSYSKIIKNMDKIRKLPNFSVNQVISPGQARVFFSNFLHILSLGFKRFNFLPACLVRWKAAELEILESEFEKIAGVIKERGDIYAKNLSLSSETPLFKHGFVVDCNGDIFSNDLILSKQYAHLRPRLKLGNVLDYPGKMAGSDFFSARPFLKAINEKELLVCAKKVDDILTRFVNRLRDEKS